jgi:hypothetical protein
MADEALASCVRQFAPRLQEKLDAYLEKQPAASGCELMQCCRLLTSSECRG